MSNLEEEKKEESYASITIIHFAYLMSIISPDWVWAIIISCVRNRWHNTCDYIEMFNILLSINCHYRYVTTNFRVTPSVKCLHSITHSYDLYLSSQIIIQLFPHRQLSIISLTSSFQSHYCYILSSTLPKIRSSFPLSFP